MSITVANARTLLTNHKENLSDVSAGLFLNWVNFVDSLLYRKLSLVDPERFVSEATVSVTSGTSSYALPSDFGHIRTTRTGLFEVDGNGKDTNTRRAQTGFGVASEGFYLSGSNIVLTPEPTKTETLKLRYIPAYTKATGDSSVLNTPDENEQLLLDALEMAYDHWDENPNGEVGADRRLERDISELLGTYSRQSPAFALPRSL